jgi:hypothetical protein
MGKRLKIKGWFLSPDSDDCVVFIGSACRNRLMWNVRYNEKNVFPLFFNTLEVLIDSADCFAERFKMFYLFRGRRTCLS